MKALTIHNPYAHLLITPQDELPDGAIHKRCENRTWPAPFRGRFAIHAGVSLKWFCHGDWPEVPFGNLKQEDFPDMAFGAIVAVAEIVDCVWFMEAKFGRLPPHLQWLSTHHHATGPYCFIIENVIRLPEPIPCHGQQKFWTIPDSVLDRVMEQVDEADRIAPAVKYVCG